jgi:hypothetical protein
MFPAKAIMSNVEKDFRIPGLGNIYIALPSYHMFFNSSPTLEFEQLS